MHGLRCTTLKFFMHRSGSLYQFFKLWGMFLIGKRSVNLQQANETKIVPWIALQRCFQNSVLLQNFQVWQLVSAQLQWSLALGFRSCLCNESIRSRKNKTNQLHSWFWDLIFNHIFFNLFHAILYQSWSNQSKSFHIELCTNYWVDYMCKKIWYLG